MTKEREALKLALEALTYIYTETTADEDELIDQALTAIKEALAQPERCKYPNCDYPCMNLPDCQMQGEPTVNTFNPDYDGVAMMYEEMKAMARELEELKAQPQRTWVELTESEKLAALYDKDGITLDYEDYADAIEAKLREKNQ